MYGIQPEGFEDRPMVQGGRSISFARRDACQVLWLIPTVMQSGDARSGGSPLPLAAVRSRRRRNGEHVLEQGRWIV
jgi:hypothetical protein